MLSPQLRRQVFELWKMFWSSGMTNPLTSIEQITYLLFIKRLESLDAERQRKGKRSIYARRYRCSLSHQPDDKVGIDQTLPPKANEADYMGCLGHGTCRWSYIRQGLTVSVPIVGPTPIDTTVYQSTRDITPHDHLTRFVFPWLRELERTLQETGNSDTTIGTRLEDAHFQLPRDKTSILQSAIKTIDDLFKQVGARSANADIMGDIFEYLLSEIETSGKNGQFRTPRHIIRFMIELLNPKAGQL